MVKDKKELLQITFNNNKCKTTRFFEGIFDILQFLKKMHGWLVHFSIRNNKLADFTHVPAPF